MPLCYHTSAAEISSRGAACIFIQAAFEQHQLMYHCSITAWKKKQFSSYRDSQPQSVQHEQTNHNGELNISRVSASAGANRVQSMKFFD